jgi:hypothetical protein
MKTILMQIYNKDFIMKNIIMRFLVLKETTVSKK